MCFVHLAGLNPDLLAPFLSSLASWLRCVGFFFHQVCCFLSGGLGFLGLYQLAFVIFRGTFWRSGLVFHSDRM